MNTVPVDFATTSAATAMQTQVQKDLGITFSVKFAALSGLSGDVDPSTNTVYVDGDLSPAETAKTVAFEARRLHQAKRVGAGYEVKSAAAEADAAAYERKAFEVYRKAYGAFSELVEG